MRCLTPSPQRTRPDGRGDSENSGPVGWAPGGGIVCRRFSFLYPDGPAPYYSVVAPSTHETSLEHYQALSDVASDAISELGATITHHHAVGRSFRPWYDKEVDPLFRDMLAGAKNAVDPDWIMNPGMLLDRSNHLKIVG